MAALQRVLHLKREQPVEAAHVSCPHPNACLTCDSFLTTAEFLPAHRQQLQRTEELLDHARTNDRQRLLDMNEPIRLNLIRVIEGLQAVEEADADGT